jgi:hypothetical protein
VRGMAAWGRVVRSGSDFLYGGSEVYEEDIHSHVKLEAAKSGFSLQQVSSFLLLVSAWEIASISNLNHGPRGFHPPRVAVWLYPTEHARRALQSVQYDNEPHLPHQRGHAACSHRLLSAARSPLRESTAAHCSFARRCTPTGKVLGTLEGFVARRCRMVH